MKKLLLAYFLSFFVLQIAIGQTQVIAHRGFWKTEGSAENSITALVKADSIGCYGSEFDVWLTKDEELIVNHDPAIYGRFIQQTSARKLTRAKLSNRERVPTLEQYLLAGKDVKTRLILELKPLNSPERETLAVKKIIDMVKSMGLEKRMEYISFSLHATKEFIRLAPQATPVYYLNGDLSPKELKEIGCTGPDYHLSVFKKNPKWLTECHELGLKINVWTVNKANDMTWFIEHKVDFITTNEPLVLQEVLK
ncbi:glycerophosphodiester phosphodiesterase family protein [Bacteroides sp. 51]|uniref:glycerophosphodiester phosphodiesterase family protein n=1 Tax=Bacteroides sp. 51 TaxID=2302938 RepID=UPI0013CFCB76|nr:glycerophosphodiester phosphodiesterase family protein [Bacteroides sp. 51]NDV83596.1 glycerophosphodiester phosphodiesterase [Bacteroides sp. 51]